MEKLEIKFKPPKTKGNIFFNFIERKKANYSKLKYQKLYHFEIYSRDKIENYT